MVVIINVAKHLLKTVMGMAATFKHLVTEEEEANPRRYSVSFVTLLLKPFDFHSESLDPL